MQEPCPFRPPGPAVLTCAMALALVTPLVLLLARLPSSLASGPSPWAERCARRSRGSYARRIPSWVLESSLWSSREQPCRAEDTVGPRLRPSLEGSRKARSLAKSSRIRTRGGTQGCPVWAGLESATPPKRNMFAWRRWVKRWAPEIPQPSNCMQTPDKGSMTMQPVPSLNLGSQPPRVAAQRWRSRCGWRGRPRRSSRRRMEDPTACWRMLDRDAFDLSFQKSV